MGIEGAKPLICTLIRFPHFFTTSETFQSGTSKRLMHFRFALDEVRSEKGEFLKQSGGLFEKEGKPCKRGLPLKAFPIQNRVLEGRSLLQSVPLLQNNPLDCSAIHSPQSALRVSTSEAVKKREYRQRMQAEGFALSTPTSPFLKGLTPKSMIL